MSEDKSERQLTEELARNVANVVSGDDAIAHSAEILKKLLGDIRQGVLRASTESLLRYRGLVASQRDREWSRVMSGIWLPEGLESAEVPTDPYQLQAVILAWQSDRERKLAVEKYRAGIQDTFRRAYVEGAKFGWGGGNMSKGLEEVVQAAQKITPSL
jgi:hypothetical protein